jgi:hypothetical protein
MLGILLTGTISAEYVNVEGYGYNRIVLITWTDKVYDIELVSSPIPITLFIAKNGQSPEWIKDPAKHSDFIWIKENVTEGHWEWTVPYETDFTFYLYNPH